MTPLTSQTSGRKKRPFLSQHDDLLDEPGFESTKTLLDQDEFDSSPSSPIQSSVNSPEPQKLAMVHFHFHDNYPSPDNPPQDVDKSCHLSDSTSTTDSLDGSSTLSAPDDHLLQLDSTSPSFQLQDTSSVELNLLLILKTCHCFTNRCFLEHHDYELFLLNQEIDKPSDNLSHQESYNCE